VRVKKGVEFAVSRRNRPLAELLEKLAAIQVNIKAFMLYTSFISNIPNVPQVAGVCKMLVDNDEEARKGLCQVKAESGTIDGWNHFIEATAFRLKSSVTLSGSTIGSP